MIKKFHSNRHRPGWKYDAKRKQYFSWGFDIRRSDGRRKREAGFLSKAEAESVVARLRLSERDERYPFLAPRDVPTVQELVNEHLENVHNRREEVRARRVLTTLCEELPKALKVTEILTTHVQTFSDRRRREGLSPSSIDRELNIISATLHAAPEYYPQLKDWNSPRIPRPKRSKRRRERVISQSEVTRVLTWLYGPQRADESDAEQTRRRNVGHVFRTALLTGARKGELCKLRWDQVDWGAMVVQIVGTKTEKRSEQTVRYLKITETLSEIFTERLAHSKGDYVFTRDGGEVTHYYRILAEACEACGVNYGRQVPGGFVTHDARHTAITRMLQASRDLATIGSITSTESRDLAMDVLENFAGKEKLGLGLDTVPPDVLILSGIRKGVVPEVGLEPT